MGSAVDVVVSLGIPPTGIIPNVVGRTLPDANVIITDANFVVGTVTYEYSDSVAVCVGSLLECKLVGHCYGGAGGYHRNQRQFTH